VKIAKLLILGIAVIAMNSCIGVSADISINANGSGRITLEYRLSQMLESLGRLDGNERKPIIPVGREDFERGVARIPGLSLRSFSSKEARGADGGRDTVIKAALDFSDTAALLAFLDITGSHVSHAGDSGNSLRLVLLEPASQALNADLVSLLQEAYAGYELRISLSAPKTATLAVSPPSVKTAQLVSQGKKVTFAIDIGDLLTLTDGLALEIAW